MKKKAKPIPIGNYIKLIVVIVITISLAFIFRNWYIGGMNYELSQSIIKESLLKEINQDEVYNYIRENENTVLYIGVVSDKECRTFEKDFNVVIKEKHLENGITYLNITNSKNKGKFLKEFNKFYGTNVLGYPSLVVIREGEVVDVLTVKTGKSLDIEDAKNFIKQNKIVSDNL